jgi:hypothetical protein
MGYKDKIKRIEEARNSDESPLVAVLIKTTGQEAWVNPANTAKENQTGGDVFFKKKNSTYTHAFEMQVSRTHKNFSYGKAKVSRFVGPEGCGGWVVLGCLDEDEKSMFYCITHSVMMKKLVDEGNPHIRLMENKYYVIHPEAFIGITGKWMGSSLEEVIVEWWREVATTTI